MYSVYSIRCLNFFWVWINSKIYSQTGYLFRVYEKCEYYAIVAIGSFSPSRCQYVIIFPSVWFCSSKFIRRKKLSVEIECVIFNVFFFYLFIQCICICMAFRVINPHIYSDSRLLENVMYVSISLRCTNKIDWRNRIKQSTKTIQKATCRRKKFFRCCCFLIARFLVHRW